MEHEKVAAEHINAEGAATTPETRTEVLYSRNMKMHRTNLKSFLEEQGGKIFSIDFIKLDNTLRTLTGRLGVFAPLVGGENTTMAAHRPYLTVFDIEIEQYRNVNLASVSQVRAGGRIYDVID